ncbi:MAG: DUF2191 domain-containing protein [Acidobacteriota bacterium]
MRTTIRLRDELLERARRKAAADGRTLTSLVEEGLMIVLSQPGEQKRPPVLLPVSKASGGVLPGVDLNHSASLLDLMEGR